MQDAVSATERDIYTVSCIRSVAKIACLSDMYLLCWPINMQNMQGDKLEIVVINKAGTKREYIDLRKD
jgi:hypothetical protein